MLYLVNCTILAEHAHEIVDKEMVRWINTYAELQRLNTLYPELGL